jgi:CDGSH-type Zn-finger protein
MNFEPKVCQKSPFVRLELVDTIKAWCSCGLSLKQPFCDGSHARGMTGKVPVVLKIEKNGMYSWCGCKKTTNSPFCDGQHLKLT